MKIVITPKRKMIIDIVTSLLAVWAIYVIVYELFGYKYDDLANGIAALILIYLFRKWLKKYIYKEKVSDELPRNTILGIVCLLVFGYFVNKTEQIKDKVDDTESIVYDISSELSEIEDNLETVEYMVSDIESRFY